ncbi:hypothetical protein M9H77_09786 [Catharanthus roseus]|uniref:Uncharacterized protein n=1 Tax=Catharanthus roseus TaxID=4058 RepID=A0ACC0C217_CATRO|nr:hypothetical protein M9H77_09786 [Catharanthus roseus]
MVSISGTLGCTPSQHDIQQTFPIQPSRHRPREHVLDRGARGVKRGTRRQPSRGAGRGRPPVPPFPDRPQTCGPWTHRDRESHFQVDQGYCVPPPPGLGFAPFQSPANTSIGFSSFRAPPPFDAAGSFTPHQPISHASSSDDEERTDDTVDVQHLGFGHRIGNKTTRFTSSDCP